MLQGVASNSAMATPTGYIDGAGETVMFWSDLTYANGENLDLIEGNFSLASPTVVATVTASQVPSYFPAAKLGVEITSTSTTHS